MRVVACPDKFRGTASAAEDGSRRSRTACVRHASARTPRSSACPCSGWRRGHARCAGWTESHFLGDRDRCGTGPKPGGGSIGDVAIVEMARASGLLLAGGAEGKRPTRRDHRWHWRADSRSGRQRRAPGHRGRGRLGDHRRRARRARRDVAAGPPRRRLGGGGVRCPHSLLRCCAHLRPAEGGVVAADRVAHPSSRAARGPVPRALRR